MVVKLVGHSDVVEEKGTGELRCGFGVVEIEVFAVTIVGAETDKITLVTDDLDESVLAEEAAHGGIALAGLLAGFDGEGYVLVLFLILRGSEIEAEDGVGNQFRHGGRSPVIHEEVYTTDSINIYFPSEPLAGVVEFGAVITAAEVVDGDLVAMDLRGGGSGDVWLPGFVVGWSESEPPGDDHGATDEAAEKPVETPFEKDKDGDDYEQIGDGGEDSEARKLEVKIDGQSCPACY
jgi:hypothetical protein